MKGKNYVLKLADPSPPSQALAAKLRGQRRLAEPDLQRWTVTMAHSIQNSYI